MFVIAPLDANTLAKLANGLCDNLLVRRMNDFFSICQADTPFFYDDSDVYCARVGHFAANHGGARYEHEHVDAPLHG